MSRGMTFEDAENSFLGKKPMKRTAPQLRRALEAVTKLGTVEYFNRILDDEMESLIWRMFIFCQRPKVGEDGKPLIVDGKAVMEDFEPNPVAFRAFSRAVEYKRGQPVVMVKPTNEAGESKIIEISIIGATPDYFEKAAKAKGLLTKAV
jgi:hypothetical protein